MVSARKLSRAVRALGALGALGALAVLALGAEGVAAATQSTPAASTLYRQAVASTSSWSVHYSSTSTQAKATLLETGDAGPASGTQTVRMGQGTISIDVIGGISYLKGNATGLEKLAGLSAPEAADVTQQWVEFATDNAAFAAVVAGVRSTDLSKELALTGPLKLERPRTIDGEAVDAIEGTQRFGRTPVHVVLYVRAHGTHVPVEEDSVSAQGRRTRDEHITYSAWGEQVRPEAPPATFQFGKVSAT